MGIVEEHGPFGWYDTRVLSLFFSLMIGARNTTTLAMLCSSQALLSLSPIPGAGNFDRLTKLVSTLFPYYKALPLHNE